MVELLWFLLWPVFFGFVVVLSIISIGDVLVSLMSTVMSWFDDV